jgi:hypothetical protein
MGRYDESIGIERYTLADAPNVEIVVPPGQKHRREATWSDLHSDIAAGKYRGVILVSAYGYHSLGDISFKDHKLFKGNTNSFLKALWKSNRQDEVAILRQLRPHLKVNPGKLWFVSLIAKQDLWWPNRSEVEQYYRKGDYGKEIRGIVNSKPSDIRHEFALVSLVIGNLITKRDELLKANAEGYDYRLQIQSLRRLFETVDALKNWESEK